MMVLASARFSALSQASGACGTSGGTATMGSTGGGVTACLASGLAGAAGGGLGAAWDDCRTR